ncbi:glyoxalase [Gordonia sp. ABSL1-1]|uniref:VOC family protein n=1 Tax=Gordonia sp. ABSL1-1 TaxID=3053923 RepID=UPI0025738CB0|nr:VOC family protein [Gordonia sp. ABSL1-1]MDL9935186.1 glyoxalase [Gordonia sp. ABSL1-1]
MAPMLFISLPVEDPARSRRFFRGLGLRFDDMVGDAGTACLIINDAAMVMLHRRGRFEGYAAGPMAPPGSGRETMLAISATSRAEVDGFADAALACGGSALRMPNDLGFMYSRSFCDPDGHAWEVVWLDPDAVRADYSRSGGDWS